MKQAKKRKDQNVYPRDWDYAKAMSIARYYDRRKEQDLLADRSTVATGPVTWLAVPDKLVPKIERMIARYRKSA